MANYKGHLAGGIFVYLLALYCILQVRTVSLVLALEWLLFTLAGALFPDVDIKSKGQKFFYWILLFLSLILLFLNHIQALVVLGFIGLVPLLVRHRGIFHNFWFIIVVPSLVATFTCMYIPHCSRIIMFDTLFFILGAISHLWLDFGLRRIIR